jgi:hypothetical protein
MKSIFTNDFHLLSPVYRAEEMEIIFLSVNTNIGEQTCLIGSKRSKRC